MILVISKILVAVIYLIYIPTLIIFRIFRVIKIIIVNYLFFFIKEIFTDLYPDDCKFDPPDLFYSWKNILSWLLLLIRWLYIIDFFCYLLFYAINFIIFKTFVSLFFIICILLHKFFLFKERSRISLKIKYANMVFFLSRIRLEGVLRLDKDVHLLFWIELKECKHTGLFFILFLLNQLLVLIFIKLYNLFYFFESIIFHINDNLCDFFKEPENYLICLWHHTYDVFLGNFPKLKKNIEETLSKSKKGRFLKFLDVLVCILTYIKNAYN